MPDKRLSIGRHGFNYGLLYLRLQEFDINFKIWCKIPLSLKGRLQVGEMLKDSAKEEGGVFYACD